MVSAEVARRIAAYYRLPSRTPPPPIPRRDRLGLLAAAVLLQVVFLIAIILGFECDAAAFYASAKGMVSPGSGISAVRPPLFPLFLVATGTVWPGTFIGYVLAQAAMGIAIPLLIHRILYGWGRGTALAGAIAVMISTTPFVGAKLVLAEQLYAFLTVSAIYWLARYHDQRDPRAIYGFVAVGLSALLTRWEAQFIFIFGCVAVVALAAASKRQLRHGIAACLAAVVVLGSYSVVRAWALGDWRLVGSLHSGSGLQLFQRVYGIPPARVQQIATEMFGSAPIIDRPQLVNAANGPASRRLRGVVAEFSRQPRNYRNMKPLMETMHREPDAPAEGPYEELFGRFDGNPQRLADNIFAAGVNFRTAQYPFYATAAAHEILGPRAGDRLLFAAGMETIWRYPGALSVMVADGFTLTGISLTAIRQALLSPLALQNWQSVFPVWGRFPGYTRVDFDAGSCASNSLSPWMMSEYRFDRELATSAFADRAIIAGALGRNIIRVSCGVIFVIGWWVLIISARRAVTFPLAGTVACLIVAIGVGVAGGNTKYDIAFIPLLVVTAAAIMTPVLTFATRSLVGHRTRSPGGLAVR